jgi:pimeloyl-ACP methyl ester carboxylesterase
MASIGVRTRDNLNLSVQVWGDPAGPEILFLHGFNQSHLSWKRQFTDPALLGCRIVTMDLRGHGGSDKPMTAESYSDDTLWADDVAAVMQATGLKKPVAVAWSYAGRIILDYARFHGTGRLAGINLVDAAIVSGRPEMLGADRRHIFDMMTDDLAACIDASVGFLRACFVKQPEPDEFAAMLAYNMVIPPMVRKLIISRSPNTGDMLPKIDVPTLVTHGARDALLLIGMGRYAAEQIPNAQLSVYDEAGHSPFYEDAPRYNAELLAFVKAANALR